MLLPPSYFVQKYFGEIFFDFGDLKAKDKQDFFLSYRFVFLSSR